MCDNMAVVSIVNTMTSKSDTVMVLLRAFTLKCLELNLWVEASHVEGVKNAITDSLSRLQMTRFRQLAPGADLVAAEMPGHLWKIFESESTN